MKNRYISNVQNVYLRRFLLALVSPLILLVCVIFGIYSLVTSTWRGIKTFGNELRYDYNQLARIVTGGVELAWMGKDAYYKRQNDRHIDRVNRMFSRKS